MHINWREQAVTTDNFFYVTGTVRTLMFYMSSMPCMDMYLQARAMESPEEREAGPLHH